MPRLDGRDVGAAPFRHGGDEAAANPSDYLLVLAPLRTELETSASSKSAAERHRRRRSSRAISVSCWKCAKRAGDFSRAANCGIIPTARPRVAPGRFHPHRPCLAGADRDRLHDRQRGATVDRVRPRQRGRPQGQQVRDRGGQRPGRFETLQHHPPAGAAGLRRAAAARRSGTRAIAADMAPQVEEAVQEYVDESHSKTVAVLPLLSPPPDEDDDAENARSRRRPSLRRSSSRSRTAGRRRPLRSGSRWSAGTVPWR